MPKQTVILTRIVSSPLVIGTEAGIAADAPVTASEREEQIQSPPRSFDLKLDARCMRIDLGLAPSIGNCGLPGLIERDAMSFWASDFAAADLDESSGATADSASRATPLRAISSPPRF